MANYMDAVNGKHTDGREYEDTPEDADTEDQSRYDQLSSMMTRTEGRAGIKTLARVSRELGYMDRAYYGQLDSDCSIGDLIEFLEDNPGAVQAVCDWVLKTYA